MGGEQEDTKRATCSHYVALPNTEGKWYDTSKPLSTKNLEETKTTKTKENNIDLDQLYFPSNPRREYSFKLDEFQRRSIAVQEREENIQVSAHTSAGKTVIAEYAISLGTHRKYKVIYTSPVKALSNQKYRDQLKTYNDVGLMTGDICINMNAQILVMTTEILRNMIVKGSTLLSEIGCVIFDEVHYMCDKERGVVWEESIIFLPSSIQLVFLSATVSNVTEFVDWISSLKKRPCHVISTTVRPVPLQHYLYDPMDSREKIEIEKNFEKQLEYRKQNLLEKQKRQQYRKRQRQQQGISKYDLFTQQKKVKEKDWQPQICFQFNRRECDLLAFSCIQEEQNLISNDERKIIEDIYNKELQSIDINEKNIQQFSQIQILLNHGIGVHHSGQIPLQREIIELQFQEGYVKILFATETFALGINMPARTVIFTTLRKFDGTTTRYQTCTEYTQMSGRAGRREKDISGNSILIVEDDIDTDKVTKIIHGGSQPLESRFRQSYSMIQSLLFGQSTRYTMEQVVELSLAHFRYLKNFTAIPTVSEIVSKLCIPQNKLKSSTSESLIDSKRINELNIMDKQYNKQELLEMQDCFRIYNSVLEQQQQNCPIESLQTVQQPGRIVYIVNRSLNQPMPSSLSYDTKIIKDTDTLKINDDIHITKLLDECISTFVGRNYGWGVILNIYRQQGYNNSITANANVTTTTTTVNTNTFTYTADVQIPIQQHTPNKIFKECDWPVPLEPLWINKLYDKTNNINKDTKYEVINVQLSMISRISSIRIQLPYDLRIIENQHWVFQEMNRQHKQHIQNNGISAFPLLSLQDIIGIKKFIYIKDSSIIIQPLQQILEKISKKMFLLKNNILYKGLMQYINDNNKFIKDNDIPIDILQSLVHMEEKQYQERKKLQHESIVSATNTNIGGTTPTPLHITQLQEQTELFNTGNNSITSNSLLDVFLDDFSQRIDVLKKQEYIDKDGKVQHKGRFASEINGVDEQVLTEMIFNGDMQNLEPWQICSIQSCMYLFEKSSNDTKPIPESQQIMYNKLLNTVEMVVDCINQCSILKGIDNDKLINKSQYIQQFRTGLQIPITLWCKGGSLYDVCQTTDMYPGSIIRILRRIVELLAQLKLAAMSINSTELLEKFSTAQQICQRGLPFSSTVYSDKQVIEGV